MKPTIPQVIDRFAAYWRKHGRSWSSLHMVLEDGNADHSSVHSAFEYCQSVNDKEGADLAVILSQMSRSQRLRLPHKVAALVNA